jgi:hypothetical protein
MLDKIIYADYTVQDALMIAGIVIGLLILFSVLKKIFRTEKTHHYMQIVRCKDCGWQGQVSRYAGRCPGCNKPLGDRAINRRSSSGDLSAS